MVSSPSSSSASIGSTKPYTWMDTSGNTYRYYKNPMMKACIFVLIQEMCERLAFYGMVPNLQTFLKHFLEFDDASANSYISMFNSIMYVTPLFSAVLADTILGLYLTIVIFSFVYMSGLTLLAASSIESISSPWMIHCALLGLIAFGSGGIKSCVNVMGAQQFHPEHHKDLITRYYTYFYACINIGSVVGGIVTPILLEEISFFASFLMPLIAFALATVVFIIGNMMGRYVKPQPQGSAVIQIIKVLFSAIPKCSVEKCKKSKGGKFNDSFIEDAYMIFRLVPLFSLIIPFVIAYNQMTTAWLTQAKKMNRDTFGWNMPASMMQNVDPVAVILTSVLVDTVIFPFLRKRNMMPSVLVRFCIGSLCGAVALTIALGMEYMIMANPPNSISIWWQVPQFWLIAAGEIFLISTSYEVAFTQSPNSLKAVASAFNLCFFSIAAMLSAVLFQVCADWLPNYDESNPTDDMIAGAHYDYYFMVLAGVCLFGAVASLAMIPYFNKVKAANQARMELTSAEEEKKSNINVDE